MESPPPTAVAALGKATDRRGQFNLLPLLSPIGDRVYSEGHVANTVRTVLCIIFVPIGIWHTAKALPKLVGSLFQFILAVFS